MTAMLAILGVIFLAALALEAPAAIAVVALGIGAVWLGIMLLGGPLFLLVVGVPAAIGVVCAILDLLLQTPRRNRWFAASVAVALLGGSALAGREIFLGVAVYLLAIGVVCAILHAIVVAVNAITAAVYGKRRSAA